MNGQLTTPVELISLALRTAGVIGVGQTPDYQDSNDCFVILNAMMAQWNRQRWLVYNLLDVSCRTTGAQSYTVGPDPTADIQTPRIDRLESAYARLLTGSSPHNLFDYPLSIIDSHEDYSEITLKQLTTFPTSIWLDSDYPIGKIYPWPVPPAQEFDLHIVIKNTISQFPTLTTKISLPPEYIDTLVWNLSARIRPLFQLPPDPTVIGLAKASLGVIRSANAQIPSLRMPREILNGNHGYDVTLGNLNGLPWGA